MKNKLSLIVAVLFLSFNLNAQEAAKAVYEYLPYVDVSVGYVPKAEINAGKFSASLNNVVLKRLGVYTSVEMGLGAGTPDNSSEEESLDSNYFSNIIGGTVTVYKSLYLFGGLDLFTSHGVTTTGLKGARKEMGIGFSPFSMSVVRLGWSSAVGPTFAIGWKFGI